MIESSRFCAAEKLSLVKILFKEVNFNASFESTEGRAGMDGKRNEENFRLTVQQRSAGKRRPPCYGIEYNGEATIPTA